MAASGGHRRWRGGLARFTVTGACLAVLLAWVDPRDVWSHWSVLPLGALVAALLCHALIIVLLGWRWQSIVGAFASPPPLGYAMRLACVTTFLNLVLPLSVGGDVGRVWFGYRAGIDLATGALAAVLDRVIGLIALGALLVLAVLLAPSHWLPLEAQFAMVVVLPAALAILWVTPALSRIVSGGPFAARIADTGDKIRRLRQQPRCLLIAVAQSLAAHLLAVAIVVAIADGLGLGLAIGDALLLVPVILLAAMLPFSIGGWGVREAAAISLLALAGVPASGALALSLLFGMTQLAVSGVGALIWLASDRAHRGTVRT